MDGEKVTRILRAKSTFAPGLAQVCFNGFCTGEKSELTELAEKANLGVVKRVTKNFAFLTKSRSASVE